MTANEYLSLLGMFIGGAICIAAPWLYELAAYLWRRRTR